MKTKIMIAVVVLVCAVSLSAIPQSKPQHWEYKSLIGKKCADEKQLNAVGSDGWELVAFSQWPVAMSTVDTCIFKRPK